ncbi:hypothetical protein NX059_009154 [Plenodomus lindquistii]|nr:hypothetical protein NX059_009154 [Plenodomus lindquistii]
MYYVPQGPYSLSRLHGYCPRHTTKELADASATCKREWEALRQSAGRRTLGQIAADFETFKQQFRDAREVEDEQLQRDLQSRVLGSSSSSSNAATVPAEKSTASANTSSPNNANAKLKVTFDTWDWRYTPRRCTKAKCKATPYSPFASHLYNFYNTTRVSTFRPLATLCPACATKEIEAFERKVNEKWGSRVGGWDEREWEEWFGNVVRDRQMEGEFWEKAQERVVREKKGGVGRVESVAVGRGKGQVMEKVKGVEEKKGEVGVGRRKSVFRRMFSSMSLGAS